MVSSISYKLNKHVYLFNVFYFRWLTIGFQIFKVNPVISHGWLTTGFFDNLLYLVEINTAASSFFTEYNEINSYYMKRSFYQ